MHHLDQKTRLVMHWQSIPSLLLQSGKKWVSGSNFDNYQNHEKSPRSPRPLLTTSKHHCCIGHSASIIFTITKPSGSQGLIAEAVLIQALLQAFLGRCEGILKPGVTSMGYCASWCTNSVLFLSLFSMHTMFDEKKDVTFSQQKAL